MRSDVMAVFLKMGYWRFWMDPNGRFARILNSSGV
jgi:hypothetical protein